MVIIEHVQNIYAPPNTSTFYWCMRWKFIISQQRFAPLLSHSKFVCMTKMWMYFGWIVTEVSLNQYSHTSCLRTNLLLNSICLHTSISSAFTFRSLRIFLTTFFIRIELHNVVHIFDAIVRMKAKHKPTLLYIHSMWSGIGSCLFTTLSLSRALVFFIWFQIVFARLT